MALLALVTKTYIGWILLAIAMVCLALGVSLALSPLRWSGLLRRGEENSPITHWYLNLWYNRWLLSPLGVRVSGVFMIVWALAMILMVVTFPGFLNL